jgi:hypothetical protein
MIMVWAAHSQFSWRINRALKAYSGEQMRLCPRNNRRSPELGRYFVTNGHRVTATHCDIMKWAIELGVLKPHEELERAVVFNE